MKKQLLILLLLICSLFIISSCGKNETTSTNATSEAVEEDINSNIIGVVTAFDDFKYELDGVKMEQKAYLSLEQLMSALQKKTIGRAKLPTPVARYLVEKYQNLDIETNRNETQSFTMSAMPNNSELIDDLNNAIEVLKNNGKIASLTKEYIDNTKQDKTDTVEFDTFEGAPTVTFALTGDLPPIDYIDDKKVPAGFSTALLSEIGKNLKINIKVVTCEASKKPVMLLRRKADVIFWMANTSDENIKQEIFTKKGLLHTIPYYECQTSTLKLKKNKDDK